MIILESQMLELKANPNRLAHGVVIEAKLTKGRGPVATLLVKNGTLHLGEVIIADKYYGKIKAMFNDRGQSVDIAPPSFAVEVSGLDGIPQVGEQFFVIEDEKTARELALERQEKEQQQQLKAVKRISLEDLHARIREGKIRELKLIIKADVQGSLEAIKETLNKVSVPEIKWNIIHEGVGSINASDVILAIASDALILGFHVNAEEGAKELSAKEGIDIRTYNIIYELANDIKGALEGMLEPKLKKVFLGRAEVRKIFKLSRAGTVAGCFVTKGKINRSALVGLLRNGEVIYEGKFSSLKRFKDDVREVQEGFDCGLTLSGFEDIKEGDIIEAYEIEKIARKL
jgi:translation initiation factor IF-2